MLARMRQQRMIAPMDRTTDLWLRRQIRSVRLLWPVASDHATNDRNWHRSLIVSLAAHTCLFCVLAGLSMQQPTESRDRLLESRWDLHVDERIDLAMTEPVVLTQSRQHATTDRASGQSSSVVFRSADDVAFSDRSSGSLITSAFLANTQNRNDLTEEVLVSAPTPSTAAQVSGGLDDSNGAGDGGAGGFFGVKPEAHRFVYVLDASRSMNHPFPGDAKTRFKRMQLELLRAITELDSESLFFVVFFNDEAIPMPADGLEPATLAGKKNCLNWMVHVEADGTTDPTQAFAIAQQLRPEIIYFLTDGWFTKKTADELLRLSHGTATIHTFSFAVELTIDVQEAATLIEASDLRTAKRRFSTEVVRKAREHVQSEALLKELAQRTGGVYHEIP